MTYTFEDIPLKLYEKIQKTNDYSLLSDEEKTEEQLKEMWQKIVDETKRITKTKDGNLMLDNVSELKMYEAKKFSIILAVTYLRSKYSPKLMSLLTGYGFKVTKENLQSDLDRIELALGDIDILINDISEKVNSKKNVEEVRTDTIIAYQSKFFGGYIDSNKITLSQYLANNEIMKESSKKQKNGKP